MEITRPRTETEKDIKSGGFLDVRYWKQNDFYQKCIVEIDNAYNRCAHVRKEPYSRTMALDYLNERIAEIEKRIKKAKDTKQENVKIDIKVDWDQFGGLKLFDFIKEEDAMTTMIISGIKQPTKTGIYRDYRCKETGCGVTIFFTPDELKNVNKKKDDVKPSDKKPEQETQDQNPQN